MKREEIQQFVADNGVKMVDLKFTDLLGTWQHFSITPNLLTDDAFTEGLGFDGSSIRAWQGIERSDMVLLPDPSTATLDPFVKETTLHLLAYIKDPVAGERYHKDPRGVAERA